MKTAIIGSGISGLATAWLLRNTHDVTIFEQADKPGGHARTIDITTANGPTPVDTGFIVLNDRNYPNLMGLFNALEIDIEASNMSFGVSINQGWLEYSSSHLFEQKRNLLRPRFWALLRDIIRFNKKAIAFLNSATTNNTKSRAPLTLEQFVDQLNLSPWFRHYYLYAMAAAIWSCPSRQIRHMPALTFLQFFNNHGLLSVNNRPQWYTVTGGSQRYVNRLIADLPRPIALNTPVEKVTSDGTTPTLTTSSGEKRAFDQIIFACHADQAATILDNSNADHINALRPFAFTRNRVVTHSDTSFMPQRKNAWASWVYLQDGPEGAAPGSASNQLSLTYWMNNLQNLAADPPILITLNPAREPQPHLTHDEHHFHHPVFDQPAIDAQRKVQSLQGRNNIWFTGAWLGYGFHEDGIKSAVSVASKLGAKVPWQ